MNVHACVNMYVTYFSANNCGSKRLITKLSCFLMLLVVLLRLIVKSKDFKKIKKLLHQYFYSNCGNSFCLISINLSIHALISLSLLMSNIIGVSR